MKGVGAIYVEDLLERKDYITLKTLIDTRLIDLNFVPLLKDDRAPLCEPIALRYVISTKVLLCLGADPNVRSCQRNLFVPIDNEMLTPLQNILRKTNNGFYVNNERIRLLIANGAVLDSVSQFNWINSYIIYVKAVRRKARTLIALKRRRIPGMVHLDRFLVRELAICIYAGRYE